MAFTHHTPFKDTMSNFKRTKERYLSQGHVSVLLGGKAYVRDKQSAIIYLLH